MADDGATLLLIENSSVSVNIEHSNAKIHVNKHAQGDWSLAKYVWSALFQSNSRNLAAHRNQPEKITCE